MRILLMAAFIFAGCGRGSSAPVPVSDRTPAPTAPHEQTARTEDPEPVRDPEALYLACEDRVEQPETDGECSVDEDCVRAGCSAETCVAKESAEELLSTCEILPCFEVLDVCGCQMGRCRWSLKATLNERPLLPIIRPE
jgi:eight-cysteine-cluster-containing protein